MKQARPPVCNRDCFRCVHPDCILDGMNAEEYRESRERNKELCEKTRQEKKIAAKQKAYYEANREEIAAKQKAYREANREELAAKRKARREQRKTTAQAPA